MGVAEMGIKSHMNGFDQGGQAADRAGNVRPERIELRNLAHDTLAIVLAGGRGSRLAELTDWRAKPAVPFGGKFRIIDFALSNCVNSGIRRIGVCTQYKAQSLIRHLQRGWSFLDGRFEEFVELLPAQQRVTADWYRGTADAVYQNIDILRRHHRKYVLILAGDHVYKMDYARMLADHVGQRRRHDRRLHRGAAGRREPVRGDERGREWAHQRLRREARTAGGHARRSGQGAREHGHLRVRRGVPV